MKKLTVFVVTLIIIFSMSFSAFANDISVYINDKKIDFSDVVPTVSENGTHLIPLRAVFEAMGTDVYWAGETNTIVCASKDTNLIFQIGNNLIFKNNNKEEVADAPIIMNSRTMITPEVIEKSFDVKAEISENAITFR